MPRVQLPPRQPFFYIVTLPPEHHFTLPLHDEHDGDEEVLAVNSFLPPDYWKKAGSETDDATS